MKDQPPGTRKVNPVPAANRASTADQDMMEFDSAPVDKHRLNPQHDAPRGPRAQPDFQDGRFGFSEQVEVDEPSHQNGRQNDRFESRRGRGGGGGGFRGGGGGLVSDSMTRRGNGRNNGFDRR